MIAAQPAAQGVMATDQPLATLATPEHAAHEACARSRAAEECVAAESTSVEERAAAECAEAEARAAADRAAAAQRAVELDLMHCFKKPGFRADQARLAIQQYAGDPDTPIEERARAAIRFLGARGRTYGLHQATTKRPGAGGLAVP